MRLKPVSEPAGGSGLDGRSPSAIILTCFDSREETLLSEIGKRQTRCPRDF